MSVAESGRSEHVRKEGQQTTPLFTAEQYLASAVSAHVGASARSQVMGDAALPNSIGSACNALAGVAARKTPIAREKALEAAAAKEPVLKFVIDCTSKAAVLRELEAYPKNLPRALGSAFVNHSYA